MRKRVAEREEDGRGRKRSEESDGQRIAKKLRGIRGIHGCVSPLCSLNTCRSSFSWFEHDMWTYIARFLDGKSLVMLAATDKWFNMVIMDESIWKFACLRDLQVRESHPVSFSWIKIYASAFDGSHTHLFRQQEKHIDWMRIGAFTLHSGVSLLTERLRGHLRIPKEGTIDSMLQSTGSCVLKNIKTGIWIADLQLVRCPVCDLSSCDGTMQTLDARHIELFLNKGYQDGSWDYDLIGSHKIQKDPEMPCIPIDLAGIFNLKSWTGNPEDSQPKAVIAPNAVAVHTRLQENEGLLVKYHVMKAGVNGDIVSIRISQQLL